LNSESSSSAIQRASGGHWGSQGDHKFLGEHGASSPFEVVPGPLLNSGIVIRRPIYQQTHGPWTVGHVSSKIQARRRGRRSQSPRSSRFHLSGVDFHPRSGRAFDARVAVS
jgi:hypothetical protein